MDLRHGAKALRVVPNKVFQGAAGRCASVTSDTARRRTARELAEGRFTPAQVVTSLIWRL